MKTEDFQRLLRLCITYAPRIISKELTIAQAKHQIRKDATLAGIPFSEARLDAYIYTALSGATRPKVHKA